MLRTITQILTKSRKHTYNCTRTRSFLSSDYMCNTQWYNALSPYITSVKIDELYHRLDTLLPKEYPKDRVSKAIKPPSFIPPSHRIDVEILSCVSTLPNNNTSQEHNYLDELRDMMYRIRLTAATCKVTQATTHATIRAHIMAEQRDLLLKVLDDRLNYGVFLDPLMANVLLDGYLDAGDLEKASFVAGLLMLQEDFSHPISAALSVLASHRYLGSLRPPPVVEAAPTESEPQSKTPVRKKKEEEVKVRVAFLRNSFFDDHFDLRDPILIAGKTLAMAAKTIDGSLGRECRLVGHVYYKKWAKADTVLREIVKQKTITSNTLQMLKSAVELPHFKPEEDLKSLNGVLAELEKVSVKESDSDAELVKIVEAAVNAQQQRDIESYSKLYVEWDQKRTAELNEELTRLERERIEKERKMREEKLKDLEERIWFFDHEDEVNLKIKQTSDIDVEEGWYGPVAKPKVQEASEYIPPEVKPRRVLE